jgi:DNA (cytosine-5)-methyltransferase 1
MKRDAFTLPLSFPGELIVDNFAGGGGTSTGLEAAFGRPVDIAINHDPEALAMHALNHPHTLHLCEDVWEVDPIAVTGNQPVALVWLSPDCKHFSKAKGGTPVEKKIRGLAWVTLRWAAKCKPRVIMLENVEEFQEWGPLIVDEDGNTRPDPAKKGRTFESFVRQLRAHGYQVDFRELRACDNGAPTIRKRFFMVARRDGLPIVFPAPTHGNPASKEVRTGKLQPWRTAAECIDFSEPAASIFDRKRPLALNTQRRVAKGAWRHVLTNPRPFIVGVGGRMGQSPERSVDQPLQTITSKADSCIAQPVVAPLVVTNTTGHTGAAANAPVPTIATGGHHALTSVALAPFIGEHANGSTQRNMPANEPLRTVCAQVKGGHFSVVAPTVVPLRGTSSSHIGNAHSIEQPISTISAGGTHHGLAAAHLVTIGYGEREGQDARTQQIEQPLGTVVAGGVKQAIAAAHLTKFRAGSSGVDLNSPMPTVTANSFVKRPGGAAPIGLVATHLTHLTHHGDRRGTSPVEPLPTVTGANRGEQALVAAFFEQANGGFYAGEGRAADQPMSTVTASGSNQQLVTAYFVKYYSMGGQWQGAEEPMHTIPTKDRIGLVQLVQVPLEALAPEYRARAKKCADLLHEHLPEHFPQPADLVLMGQWVLVDITLRMLKPPELYRAQGFPRGYKHDEIPNPKLLFANGRQVPQDPRTLPRIPLTLTAQVRMCGNSVSPVQAEALVRVNFSHERLIYGLEAA